VIARRHVSQTTARIPVADDSATARALAKYPEDTAVQRACMEIERMRRVFLEIESYRIVTERCWRQETRGQLVALEKMRTLIAGERSRLGISSADVPPAPDYAGKRYP
jgi:hypothetical protein